MRGSALASLILVPLLASCYSPEIPSGKFACQVDGDCPGSFLCRQVPGQGLRCVEPGGGGGGGGAGAEDLASAPAPSGCRDGGKGTQLSNDVWACRGAFGVGRGGELCADAFRWCGKSDESKLQLGDACSRLSGFFLANQWAGDVTDVSVDTSYGIACERLSGPFGWQGCGTEDGARVVSARQGPCIGVTTLMRCDRGKGWTCEIPGMRYDGKSGGGALCCRR